MILYVAVVALLAAQDSFAFVRKSAIVPMLCVAALLSSRFTLFLRDWAVFLGLTLVFDALRGLIFTLTVHFELPVHMTYAIDAERALLGGRLMPALLQAAWFDPAAASWLDALFVIVHASHFVYFLGVGFIVWMLRPDRFRLYTSTMLALMYAGLLVYLLLPTVPPWMAAADYHAIEPVQRIGLRLYNASVPTLVSALATNPIAAMPSLHAAFPVACSLLAVEVFGRGAWWTAAYALVVALAVMYLGEHYLVDVLAGWMLACVVYAGVCRWHAGAADPQSVTTGAVPALRATAKALAVGFGLFVVAALIGQARTTMGARVRPYPFIEDERAGSPPADGHAQPAGEPGDGAQAATPETPGNFARPIEKSP